MRRSGPVQSLPAIVAGKTLAVLHLGRRAPILGEADQRAAVGRIADVIGTRPMTRFAHLPFELGFGILSKSLGVQRVGEVPVLHIVAAGADFLANVRRGPERSDLGRCRRSW